MRYLAAILLAVFLLGSRCRADVVSINYWGSIYLVRPDGTKQHHWIRGYIPNQLLNDDAAYHHAYEKAVNQAKTEAARIVRIGKYADYQWGGLAFSQNDFFHQRALDLPMPPQPQADREVVAAILVKPSWGDQDGPQQVESALNIGGKIGSLFGALFEDEHPDPSKVLGSASDLERILNYSSKHRGGTLRESENFSLFAGKADGVEWDFMLPRKLKSRVVASLRRDKKNASDKTHLTYLRSGVITDAEHPGQKPPFGDFAAAGVRWYLADIELASKDLPAVKGHWAKHYEALPLGNARIVDEGWEEVFRQTKGYFWIFGYKTTR